MCLVTREYSRSLRTFYVTFWLWASGDDKMTRLTVDPGSHVLWPQLGLVKLMTHEAFV